MAPDPPAVALLQAAEGSPQRQKRAGGLVAFWRCFSFPDCLIAMPLQSDEDTLMFPVLAGLWASACSFFSWCLAQHPHLSQQGGT